MRWPGRYLRPAGRPTVPSEVWALVVDERITAGAATGEHTRRAWNGAWVVHATRSRGRWSGGTECRCDTPADLRVLLVRNGALRRRNWVVTPDAVDALTLSGWWGFADEAGVQWAPKTDRTGRPDGPAPPTHAVSVRRLCVNGRVGILDYSQHGQRWVWVSGRNYFAQTEDSVAASLCFGWPDTGADTAAGHATVRTARERAWLWMAAFQSLTDWWGEHSSAPFAMTAGSCAVGILRSHLEAKALCTHGNADVHRLEREASFGGRATVWCYARIGAAGPQPNPATPAPENPGYPSVPGPAVRVDVRSMYPHILATARFPVALTGHYFAPKVRDVLSWHPLWGVVAAVRVRTNVGEFPARDRDRIVYPTGEFDTVLTGPELAQVRRSGRVVAVHEAATYRMGTPFRAAAAEMIAMREEHRDAGRAAWEGFAKLMSNSLGGKLAQRSGRWVERRKKIAIQHWGEWNEPAGNGAGVRRFRGIAGLVWEWVEEPAAPGPYTAAFAYLTAWGRLWMRRVRERMPAGSCFQQDTDGLWCSPAGVDALRAAGVPFGDAAGDMRVVEVTEAAQFLGPRHYWTCAGWVLAGLSDPRVLAGGKKVADRYTRSPVRGATRAAPECIDVIGRTSELRIEPVAGAISPEGWWHPPFRG